MSMIMNFFDFCCTSRRKKDDSTSNNADNSDKEHLEKEEFSYTSDSTAENNECFNFFKITRKPIIFFDKDPNNFYVDLVF